MYVIFLKYFLVFLKAAGGGPAEWSPAQPWSWKAAAGNHRRCKAGKEGAVLLR